jgi:hypothetical protein
MYLRPMPSIDDPAAGIRFYPAQGNKQEATHAFAHVHDVAQVAA